MTHAGGYTQAAPRAANEGGRHRMLTSDRGGIAESPSGMYP